MHIAVPRTRSARQAVRLTLPDNDMSKWTSTKRLLGDLRYCAGQRSILTCVGCAQMLLVGLPGRTSA
eukprot:1947566-Heterocapsa_arctica.AAC.1